MRGLTPEEHRVLSALLANAGSVVAYESATSVPLSLIERDLVHVGWSSWERGWFAIEVTEKGRLAERLARLVAAGSIEGAQ